MTTYLGLEEAARFVEQHELVHTSEGEQTRPRRDGNRAGLGYASGIRALANSASLSQAGAGGGVVAPSAIEAGCIAARDSNGCGCSLGGETVFCDDPRLPDPDTGNCSCRKDATAAILAALAPSPSAEKVVNREAADAGRAAYVARYGTTPDTEPLWDDLPSDVKAIWRRVGMAARSTPPATPVQPTASVEAVGLHDFITHRTAWRNALIICEGSAQAKGDEDNRSYWSHEIGAFDRAFTIIEPLARASLTPPAGEGEAVPVAEDDDHHRPDASGYSRADEDWFFDMDGKP